MVVLIIENVKPSVRGEMTRWMIEPKPGVFVGTLSGMVRDKLWDYLQEKAAGCGAIMIYNAPTEQRFAVRTAGDTSRLAVDLDGITLIKRLQKVGAKTVVGRSEKTQQSCES
jgi:CRISPR-associated protein Cas2